MPTVDDTVCTKVLSTTIKTYFRLFSTKYGKFQPNIQIFDYSVVGEVMLVVLLNENLFTVLIFYFSSFWLNPNS